MQYTAESLVLCIQNTKSNYMRQFSVFNHDVVRDKFSTRIILIFRKLIGFRIIKLDYSRSGRFLIVLLDKAFISSNC